VTKPLRQKREKIGGRSLTLAVLKEAVVGTPALMLPHVLYRSARR
jgi:hypothetical protein